MKQKILITVSMHDDKCRSKALQIAVCVSGVDSVSLIGEGKNQLQVIGEGIDSTELVVMLRKKVAYAELVSVGEDKKEPPKPKVEEKPKPEDPRPQPPIYGWPASPRYGGAGWQCVEVRNSEPSCTIM